MARHHNDEPTLEDQLERLGLVRTVGDTVATCTPPAVMGIHGDWGCGKTSFLHLLHLYLTGVCPPRDITHADKEAKAHKVFDRSEGGKVVEEWNQPGNVVVVWFEAWRYQQEAAPIVALLQEMRTQLSWHLAAFQKGKKVLEVAVRSAFLGFEDLTKKIGIQASKIEKTGRQWEEDNLATKLPSHAVREQLEHALDGLLKGIPKRKGSPASVVVLIDDLDRCQPEVAFTLLEGIKIYLTLKNCVFVLGMDQRIIQDAIAKEIPGSDKAGTESYAAQEYLGKICQNIVHLPFVSDQASFLARFIGDKGAAASIVRVLRSHPCLPRNPRKIKAFANVIQRYMDYLPYQKPLNSPSHDGRHAELIVTMAYIYQFHPQLYRILETQPQFYGALLSWCRGDDDVPLLKDFHRAVQPTIPPQAPPGTEPTFIETYVDPTTSRVLGVQNLIIQLGEATTDEIKGYLLDQPRSSEPEEQ